MAHNTGNLDPNLQQASNFFSNKIGSPNHPFSHSLYNPRGKTSDEIRRDLWASWEGDNFKMSEMFLRSLTTRGQFIKNLLPVMRYPEAIQKYNLRAKGDEITFDVWNYSGAVGPDHGRRHEARRATSSRSQYTRSFQGGGAGFNVPMDWLESDTKQQDFFMHIEQMNASIYLTWTFRVMQTLVCEGIDIYSSRLQALMPFTHAEFRSYLATHVARTFVLNKNGSGFGGVESQVVSQGQTRGVEYDTVIVPRNSMRALNVERAPLKHYWMGGEKTYAENQDLRAEGNVTKHYQIKAYESKCFEMGNGQRPVDPLTSECVVSQRFLMLPGPTINAFRGYRTHHRDIEVADGDTQTWTRITLREALEKGGLWMYHSGNFQTTNNGKKILDICCGNEGRNNGGMANRNQQHNQLNQQPENCEWKEGTTAYSLYQKAGILQDVIARLVELSDVERKDFVAALYANKEANREYHHMPVNNHNSTRHMGGANRARGQKASLNVDGDQDDDQDGDQHMDARANHQPRNNGGSHALGSAVSSGSEDVDALLRKVFEPGRDAKDFFRVQVESKHVAALDRINFKFHAEIDDSKEEEAESLAVPYKDAEGNIYMPYVGPDMPESFEEAMADDYYVEMAAMATGDDVKVLCELVDGKHLDEAASMRGTCGKIMRDRVEKNNNFKTDFPTLIRTMSAGTNPQLHYIRLADGKEEDKSDANILEELVLATLDPSAISREKAPYVKGFVSFVFWHMNALASSGRSGSSHAERQIKKALQKLQGKEEYKQLEIVSNTMQILLESGELPDRIERICRPLLHDAAVRPGKRARDREGVLDSGSDKRHASAGYTTESARQLLLETKPDYNFFNAVLRANVPCPLAAVLFRMHVRVESSALIFMVAGPKTGVVVIKDGFLTFTRRNADFSIDVSTRFRTGTFITERDNLELVPHAMAHRYLGGAGTRLYDPNVDRGEYKKAARRKDIHVHLVPYRWRPSDVFTDITGRMHPAIYNGAEMGHDTHTRQYYTADVYNEIWGHTHHNRDHIFSCSAMGNANLFPTLALQAAQRVHSGDAGITQLTAWIDGHDQIGSRATPKDYAMLQGTAAAYAGSGIEGVNPRHTMF